MPEALYETQEERRQAGFLASGRGLPGSQAAGHRPNLASPHVALGPGPGPGQGGCFLYQVLIAVPPVAHPLGVEI